MIILQDSQEVCEIISDTLNLGGDNEEQIEIIANHDNQNKKKEDPYLCGIQNELNDLMEQLNNFISESDECIRVNCEMEDGNIVFCYNLRCKVIINYCFLQTIFHFFLFFVSVLASLATNPHRCRIFSMPSCQFLAGLSKFQVLRPHCGLLNLCVCRTYCYIIASQNKILRYS